MKTLKNLTTIASALVLIYGCTPKATVDSDPTPAPGTTNISGNVEGTWKKGQTYVVDDVLYIKEGTSLTIEEGVTVLFNTSKAPEVIIDGNFYSMGTEQNPVKFTVADSLKTDANKFGKLWGGLIASPKCAEMVIKHTTIEYGGATTTEESASVKAGLYKAESGANVPAIYYNNVNGKLIVMHSRINNFQDDGFYIEGGKVLIANNVFHTTGISGGDAVNIKSGVLADIVYNVFYSPNTNAMKLSNGGGKTPQTHIIAYNNTIINAGNRRPDIKGGSIWLEKSVRCDAVNNLIVNSRFGIKRDRRDEEDKRSTVFNTHYYGNTQLIVNSFQPSNEIMVGTNDIISTVVGFNDPQFVNYPVTDAGDKAQFDNAWDFHLKDGAPGLGKGKTDIAGHHKDGLIVNGITYNTPLPADYIGAKGKK